MSEKEVFCSVLKYRHKDLGIVQEIIHMREGAGQEETRQNFVDDVVSSRAFLLLKGLFHCVQSSGEWECFVGEPQYKHDNMKRSVTSGISFKTLRA